MAEFNLIDEPWIPCIDLQGKRVEYGIKETLLKAHELQEIVDDSPLVTVSIHRMLLAILYRAFEGPTNIADWRKLWEAGQFASDGPVTTYLDKWRDRFFLFHDTHPFMQVAGLEASTVTINRLAMEVASGNNATLFGHNSDERPIPLSRPLAARLLLAYQSFAIGGGNGSRVKIRGREEKRPNLSDGIALRGMNVWVQGASLFQTLLGNLAPLEALGSPCWEADDPNLDRDRKGMGPVLSRGVTDRFSWLSRICLLIPSGHTVSFMAVAQGRSADKSVGDPMKVYRLNKKSGVLAMPLSLGKSAWRDAHAILGIPQSTSGEHRPECFNLLARANVHGMFSANIVGVVSESNKAAKIFLWRHERVPVPVALLNDVNLIERLGGLLQNAEQAGQVLNERIRRVANLYLSPTAEDKDGRKPDEKDVTNMANDLDPRPAYWARLERHFFNLLENLPNDWDVKAGGWKPDEEQKATIEWRKQVKYEAQRALEESIRQLGTTARAIQAVARVRTDFNDDDLKPPAQKQPKAKGKGGKKK